MSLTNVAYYSALTWADPSVRSLEAQALRPLTSEHPVELGFAGHEAELLDRMRSDRVYSELFPRAFPQDAEPFAIANIARALASFERTLISGDSPYDRFASGLDPLAISAEAKRGAALFFGERFECHHCHGLFALAGSVTWEEKAVDDLAYHNTGLYNVDEKGGYPASDRGLMEATSLAADMGRFRAPTLRNIALTAPYMHDGSIADLRSVLVDHYARGGRLSSSGDGARSPLRANFVPGFTATDEEIEDMLAFLASLTDETFLRDARFANPW